MQLSDSNNLDDSRLFIASYPVDLDRVHLTDLSMGGYGTWHLAAAQPERFAAIAPICGGGEPAQVHKLKNLPVWAFHGAKDNVVPLSESKIMVSALKTRDGNVKFTVYPEADQIHGRRHTIIQSCMSGFCNIGDSRL
ncbi:MULTISPECIES: dienelactone hydrolase family protein [unclassified Nostoc]|uniref:carboxylesterase family protein n=1 Tax=unclassified Nostoc TaxID=2593658 RepID=UPI00289338E5|nr:MULTISPECIES: dienelactone hydrolase family protein [unclassified Nostoc]